MTKASAVTDDSAGRKPDVRGIGEWCADRMRNSYCFDHDNNQWYVFKRNHWTKIDKRVESAIMYDTLDDISACLDKETGDIVRGYGNNAWTKRQMVEIVQGKLAIAYEDFQGKPWLLNVSDGLVDLRHRSFRQSEPGDMMLGYAPVEYNPEATCDAWIAFLKRSLGDRSDMLTYVQQMCGLLLTGEQLTKAGLFVYGLKHTGKSVFLATLHALLGETYSTSTKMDIFREGSYSNAKDYKKALLAGKRMVYVDETSSKLKIASEEFKTITSGYGATENARQIYGKPFKYRVEYTLVVGTNELPKFDTNDPALWDRVHPVLFVNPIPKEE
jgi:P4 family phage/plasmid primase-like protien